jgi:hypothetical protein
MKTPNWICVDEHFCSEFGETVTDCIERYRNSMDEYVDVTKLTFYTLTKPYVVEIFYALKEKNPMES